MFLFLRSNPFGRSNLAVSRHVFIFEVEPVWDVEPVWEGEPPGEPACFYS